VDGIEALRPGGIENSGQIDHGVRPFAGRSKRGGITHIGLNWHDLAGSAERLQVPGEIRSAATHADAIPAPRQRPDDVSAEKA
jgi:hypothetical protein